MFIVMKWMKGEQRFGIVNVFSADDVVKAEIIDRGETRQIVLGRGIQDRLD